MILSTTNSLEGHRVSQYCGLVSGQAILGANVFRDIFASMRDAREHAIADMVKQAEALGANAIVGIEIDYSAVGSKGSMLMVSANCTAVKLG